MMDAPIAANAGMTTTTTARPATSAGRLTMDRPRRPNPNGRGGPEGPWWRQPPMRGG